MPFGLHAFPFAIAVIAALAFVGLVISLVKSGNTFAGYTDIRREVQQIANALKAELFRDGDDLVVAGQTKKHPVQIRFSYALNTPGLNIRMQAPVSFTFSVVPKGETASEGRAMVRTGDDMFDARFTAKTDHPTQAKMLLGSKQMRTHMEKLCCSSKSYFTMTTGLIEQSELVIPAPYTVRHILDHVDSMAVLASGASNIPGAEGVKIGIYKRENTSFVTRAALAAGALATIIAVFVIQPRPAQADISELKGAKVSEGIMPKDVPLIPFVNQWRAANESDYPEEVAAWIKSAGGSVEGRVSFKMNANDALDSTAYMLVSDAAKPGDVTGRRVVIISNNQKVYDSQFPTGVALVKVPQGAISGLQWKQAPRAEAPGDALMVIKQDGAAYSGAVLFSAAGHFQTGIPENYQNISLN
jgi:hypothetical protein